MSRSNRSSSSAGDSTQSNGVRHRTGATRKSGTFQPPALPKWVPDAEQSSCMLCSRKFGLVSRRHHCRNCGILVCQTCSNHMIPLLQSGTTPVRVCDRCYETLSMTDTETRTIMPVIKGETTVVRRSQSFADPRFGRPSLPTWTYAFTSCAPDDAPVSIGRLTIRIRGSTALPPVDYFGTADPYVVVTLGTQSVKTKIQPKTLTPTWNEEFVLDVTNARASVKMEIWDSDQLGFDRLMGYTTISLPDLSHQLRVAKSLPITWSENEGVTHVKTAAHLNVELHYTYSTIGAFISQFHPESHQQHDHMDYDTDLLYTQGVRLWSLCQPILTAITAITSLLNWSHPLFSALVLSLYLYVALHPWTAAVLIHLALIRYLIWQYVYRVWERGTEKERIRSESLATLDKNINGVEGKVSSVPPLAPVFVGTVNEATHIAGMTEELTQLQHMITHLCTLLESISNLFTWKHPSHTRTFLIFLLLSLAYCCFLPQQYLLLILGVYVLTQQTAPIQTITWIWDGTHRWITRKRIDPKTVPASERVTIPLGPRLVGTARITERLMAEFE